jgi:hypothetical protein
MLCLQKVGVRFIASCWVASLYGELVGLEMATDGLVGPLDADPAHHAAVQPKQQQKI